MPEKKKNSVFMGIFDVMFIMILCFGTLLTTMLMQGGVLVGGDGAGGIHYTFGAASFGAVVLGFGLYLYYILPHSDKELREMIAKLYAGKE